MRRTLTALVALVVVVSMVAAAPMAVAGQAYAQEDDESDDDNEVAPGEQFAGVVAVHESEFEGEMDERTFGIKVAQSASAEAQGEVVGEQLEDVEQRLSELEDRVDELEEKRNNGEITEGEFQAEMAVVASERRTAANLAAQSEASTEGLDEGVLSANDIDVDTLMTLQDRANELGGPAVADAAQRIAGGSAAAADDRGPSVEIGVRADGEVGVDIPGGTDLPGVDDDGEEDSEREGETDTEAGADADAEASTDGGDTEADSGTEVDAKTDDGTEVDAKTETDAGADL